MAKIRLVCTVCEEKSKNDGELVSCPICNTNLTAQNETLIKKVDCNTHLSGVGTHGEKGVLYLTNQRLFWLKRAGFISLGGAGVAFYLFWEATVMRLWRLFVFSPSSMKMRFSIPLGEITNAEERKVAMFRFVQVNVGETIYLLDMKKRHRQEWIDAINATRNG